jgi:hypothetical protein
MFALGAIYNGGHNLPTDRSAQRGSAPLPKPDMVRLR